MIAYLFVKAASLPLFGEGTPSSVEVAGHLRGGTWVAPYRSTRKKKPAPPQTADLFGKPAETEVPRRATQEKERKKASQSIAKLFSAIEKELGEVATKLTMGSAFQIAYFGAMAAKHGIDVPEDLKAAARIELAHHLKTMAADDSRGEDYRMMAGAMAERAHEYMPSDADLAANEKNARESAELTDDGPDALRSIADIATRYGDRHPWMRDAMKVLGRPEPKPDAAVSKEAIAQRIAKLEEVGKDLVLAWHLATLLAQRDDRRMLGSPRHATMMRELLAATWAVQNPDVPERFAHLIEPEVSTALRGAIRNSDANLFERATTMDQDEAVAALKRAESHLIAIKKAGVTALLETTLFGARLRAEDAKKPYPTHPNFKAVERARSVLETRELAERAAGRALAPINRLNAILFVAGKKAKADIEAAAAALDVATRIHESGDARLDPAPNAASLDVVVNHRIGIIVDKTGSAPRWAMEALEAIEGKNTDVIGYGTIDDTPLAIDPSTTTAVKTPAIRADFAKDVAKSFGSTELATLVGSRARRLGMSVEAMKKAMTQAAVRAMARAVPWTAIHDESLLALLEGDGTFKNQSLTGSSGGMLNPQGRESFEEFMWDFGDIGRKREMRSSGSETYKSLLTLEEALQRPKYGYLCDADDRWGFGTGYDPTNVYNRSGAEGYGNIRVRFKDHVRERTTFTPNDSLRTSIEKRPRGDSIGRFGKFVPNVCDYVPAPVNAPDWRAVAASFPVGKKPKEVSRIYDFHTPYVEAQFHGNLTIDDVAEVVIGKTVRNKEHLAAITKKLDEKGIPWRRERD